MVFLDASNFNSWRIIAAETGETPGGVEQKIISGERALQPVPPSPSPLRTEPEPPTWSLVLVLRFHIAENHYQISW